jgi:Fe-S-cluster-containing hydrogenase component 2
LRPSSGESALSAVSGGPGLLVVIPRNCIGCRTCELACSFAHSTGGTFARARIKVHQVGDTQEPQQGAASQSSKRCLQMTCLQCLDAACVKVCPVEAIERNAATGAIEVNEQRCVGCSLCEKVCPFGHMHFDRETRRAVKCDLCKGSPACARFCPNRALEIR